ncbi:hypothetical protein L596_002484 [Steinernema carpocapsae]|uniref:Uncharacterized protein n=1 Tax=Steinernema carpocapsae TaxID=34508 RepID=A0A4U8US74_STECR|nr:hypothetical protein L596_002484 [Steinernema carpocapsae]
MAHLQSRSLFQGLTNCFRTPLTGRHSAFVSNGSPKCSKWATQNWLNYNEECLAYDCFDPDLSLQEITSEARGHHFACLVFAMATFISTAP